MTFPTLSAAEVSTAKQEHPKFNEELILTLNTAFVRARANDRGANRDLAAELAEASASPATAAILSAVRQLARTEKIGELDAAEQVIRTFRKLDEIWGAYLYQEGLARITSAE